MKLKVLFITLLGIFTVTSQAQDVVYVSHAAMGANDGTSWDNAFNFLQDALAAAESGDEIWVAAGVYHPDKGENITEGDRSATFALKNGVGIYGGFIGSEGVRSERDLELNETVLSGDLLGNDNNVVALEESTRLENTYNIITANSGIDSTSVLDGFTIRGGHANPSTGPSSTSGGGILILPGQESHINITNMKFVENFSAFNGGAIANYNGDISISKSSFTNNVAGPEGAWGGAIYHEPRNKNAAMAEMKGLLCEGNVAEKGGAISVRSGSLLVTDAVFLSNQSTFEGGAVHHDFSSLESGAEAHYFNVLFLGNESKDFGGGAMFIERSNVSVYNALFSGNRAVDVPVNRGAVGGAIANIESSEIMVAQSVFVNNTADVGGAFYNNNSSVELVNSIVWNNESRSSDEENFFVFLPVDSVSFDVASSLFSDDLPDTVNNIGGVIIGDPLFVSPLGEDGVAGTLDDNLRLQKESPAIDAGDNTFLPHDIADLDEDNDFLELLPIDIDGYSRIVDSGQGEIVDLGSYEFDATLVSNELPVSLSSNSCPSGSISPIYPNPFLNIAYANICMTRTGLTQVMLYDVLGRVRQKVFEGVVRAGVNYSIVITRSNLPSGLYMIEVRGADIKYSQPVIITN